MHVAHQSSAQPLPGVTVLLLLRYLASCDVFFSSTRIATALVQVVLGTYMWRLCHTMTETFQIWQETFQKRKYCKWALFGVGIPNLGVAVTKHTIYGNHFRENYERSVFGIT